MNARTRWIGAIVGMLSFPVALYGLAFVLTANDPSFRVDRGYKQRTEVYDEDLIQRAANDRLNWSIGIAPAHREGVMELRATDSSGLPLISANVEIELFHAARSALATTLRLSETGPGQYETAFAPRHSGQYVARATLVRGSDRYVRELRFWADAVSAANTDDR